MIPRREQSFGTPQALRPDLQPAGALQDRPVRGLLRSIDPDIELAPKPPPQPPAPVEILRGFDSRRLHSRVSLRRARGDAAHRHSPRVASPARTPREFSSFWRTSWF